jgi:hypothetical protein
MIQSSNEIKLRKPQQRILEFLSKHPMKTRKQISQYASVDYAYLTEYLGAINPEHRAATEQRTGISSLLSLELVMMEKMEIPVDNASRVSILYSITDRGKSLLV